MDTEYKLDPLDAVLAAINNLTQKVEAYHGDFREFRGAQTAKVKALEDEAKSAKLWGRIQKVVTIPLLAVLHQGAQYIGWIK